MGHFLVETLITGKNKWGFFFSFILMSVRSHLAMYWVEDVYVIFSFSLNQRMNSFPKY